jgi:hypothetical protein
MNLSCLITVLVLFYGTCFAQDWKEAKGEHFLVYFTQNELVANDVLKKAEVYYRDIAIDLGYPRYSDFWTWDNRVKIYIYPDHDSYIKATSQPDWSQGLADYKKKQIISYAWSKGFVDSLLPHEITHLIFRDFVGFKGQIPLWLDEGVAQWSEKNKRKQIEGIVKELYLNNALISLEDMMKLDVRRLKDKEKVYIRSIRTKEGQRGILFLSAENLVNTYYVQAVSLVEFLIDRYGADSFANFCRQLRDGKDLEEALKFAYPMSVRGMAELEDKWREYIAGKK